MVVLVLLSQYFVRHAAMFGSAASHLNASRLLRMHAEFGSTWTASDCRNLRGHGHCCAPQAISSMACLLLNAGHAAGLLSGRALLAGNKVLAATVQDGSLQQCVTTS